MSSARAAWRALVVILIAVVLRALCDTWPFALAAWATSGLVVFALVVSDAEPGEVQHVAILLESPYRLCLGVMAVWAVTRAGAPPPAQVAALALPALVSHVRLAVKRRRAIEAEIDGPRLRGLGTRELLVEVGRTRWTSILVELYLERGDAREVALAAARDGPDEHRRGALEVAVFAGRDRALARDVVRAVLGSSAPDPEHVRRALVAVRDVNDSDLVELLRGLRLASPEDRLALLEARTRAGDATTLDEWLADELDATTSAGALGLALGPVAATRARLVALQAVHAEGSRERARLDAMLEALSLFR